MTNKTIYQKINERAAKKAEADAREAQKAIFISRQDDIVNRMIELGNSFVETMLYERDGKTDKMREWESLVDEWNKGKSL